MRVIALIAVVGIVLLEFSGLVPQSSVGGPLTLMLMFLLTMLAVGLYEAWSQRRGVLGWIVSVVASVVGGFVGVSLGSMVMELVLPYLGLEGSLASTRHPLLYISSAAMMLLTLAGSWMGLWLVNRLR